MNNKLEYATQTSQSEAIDGEQADPSAAIEDLPADTDPKGGILIGLLLPAVQKVRG